MACAKAVIMEFTTGISFLIDMLNKFVLLILSHIFKFKGNRNYLTFLSPQKRNSQNFMNNDKVMTKEMIKFII